MLALALACYSLYWVVGIVQPLVYRVSFLLVVLVLTFLVYPGHDQPARSCASVVGGLAPRRPGHGRAAVAAPDVRRLHLPRGRSVRRRPGVSGAILILLVLEATRRTAGWILPFTAVCFLVYTFYGPLLELIGLGMVAHRGYDVARIVGTIYMTLEGVFGVPLEVASTYIILFSIYGAILAASGAGQFFLEWSMAAVGGSGGGAGPGRAVTVAGLLLGTVSGSGVANTVDARLRRVADAEASRLRARHGRRDPVGRGHRRHHLPTGARRRGVHHRGVPAHHLSAGDRDGGDPGAPLLLLDLPDDRGRHATRGRTAGPDRDRVRSGC